MWIMDSFSEMEVNDEASVSPLSILMRWRMSMKNRIARS
jgi:hypothetical protein